MTRVTIHDALYVVRHATSHDTAVHRNTWHTTLLAATYAIAHKSQSVLLHVTPHSAVYDTLHTIPHTACNSSTLIYPVVDTPQASALGVPLAQVLSSNTTNHQVGYDVEARAKHLEQT